MKKLFAVLVALTLVLSMGAIAMAATTGTITINNAVVGENYTVYKMFDFVPVAGSANQGRYTVVAEWEDFLNGAGAAYLKTNAETGTIEWVGETSDVRKAELAKAAIAYADEKNNETAGTIKGTTLTAETSTVTFDGLDLGYYAIDTSLGNICALTNTNSQYLAFEKNSGGTITKEVQENSNNTWGETNDANIGETVNFRAVITAGKGSYNYVMHDTMSAGLTFNSNSVVLKKNGTGDPLTLNTDYTVETGTCAVADCNCTFRINLSDTFEATFAEKETVVVEYSAVLNENAVIAGAGNPNEVYLTYGNAQKTNKETTVTYTYQFQLVKTVDDNTVLNGAEFKLYDAAEGGKEIPVVKVSDSVYRVAKEGETGVVIEAGYVTIRGLDSAQYWLEETKAPEGYNKVNSRQSVTISAANNNATVTEDKYVSGGVQVINKTGSLLPETGGIGTTIFYVVGGLLMAAALIVLVSKKRMATFA
ncbi:MAG: SpaH/EbpB family LPXTG-anchored major pilin [Clostridia bacterium]|nr:SpaH/EbpB family LPXTG-anchored major pilin [Clostridia bacterium]